MQKLTRAWENLIDKSKIWDEGYLVKNENFIKWLDDNGFYGEGSTAQYNDNVWGIDIYYVNINVLKILFIENMIIIETQQEPTFGTMRELEDGKFDNERYWNKKIKTDNEEEIEELKQWILKVKNLILNHLTSKIKINTLELQNFKLFEK